MYRNSIYLILYYLENYFIFEYNIHSKFDIYFTVLILSIIIKNIHKYFSINKSVYLNYFEKIIQSFFIDKILGDYRYCLS